MSNSNVKPTNQPTNQKEMSVITLIAKPCQSGKTFEMIKTIADDNKKMTEVVFTDNLINQSQQLQSRLHAHSTISQRPIYTIHSKNKNKKEKNIQYLLPEIQEGANPVIVMPTNRSKLDNLRTIIQMISDTKCNVKVRVWFDEIDCHLRLITPLVKMLLSKDGMFECVESVYGLTATGFSRVCAEFKQFKIHKWNPADLDNYYGFTDSGVQFVNMSDGSSENNLSSYIRYVMDHHSEELTKKGNCVFMPADFKNKSHIQTCKFLLDCGMDRVLILNQHGLIEWSLNPEYEVTEEEAEEEAEEDAEEISARYHATEIDTKHSSIEQVLKDRYDSQDYQSMSIAMIGNMKFRRGLTMQHRDGFIFTHAIGAMSKAKLRIPDASDNFTQLMSRVCGQFNDVRESRKSHIKVYTTADAMNALLDNEHKSTKLTKEKDHMKLEEETVTTQLKFPNAVYAQTCTFITHAQYDPSIPLVEAISIR